MKLSQIYLLVYAVLFMSFAPINATADQSQEDRDPKSLVISMAKTIAFAKEFSVTIDMAFDVVQKTGQKIQFSENRQVSISRPDSLRVDVHKSNGDRGRVIFDGQTITLFNSEENVYSQTPHKGDVNSAIRYAVSKLGMRVPLARMLVTTFPQEIESISSNIDYIEQNTLGEIPTDHISGQTNDVDYQIWISEAGLPQRIVMTYKNAPGQPQFQAVFSDWDLTTNISDSDFNFTPPKDAEKIPRLLPTSQATESNDAKGEAK